MTTYMYTMSVPVFKQLLNSLSAILTKAEVLTTEKKFEPTVLLDARLYPDMFPLIRQVQIATDFAKSVSARLAGVDVPAYDDNEQSFTELQGRIGKTLSCIESLTPEQFEGSETREIVLRPGTPKEKKWLATPTCPTTVCRNFSSMSPLPMRFCGTMVWKSAKEILWVPIKVVRV